MSLDTLGLVTSADVQSDLLIVSNRSIVSELQSFEFYPNPVSSILTMNLPDGSQSIRILDVAGRTVREFGNFGRRAELSVSGLKDGVYVIESASDSGEISHKRLLIRH
jgi:hypothetical protein